MREIETARLHLKQFSPDDLDNLYRLYSDRAVMKYVGKGVRTREETEMALHFLLAHWEKHGFGLWAAIHKMDERIIGRCGLVFLDNTPEVELGYLLEKAYWGRGLATEASLAILKYGFDTVKLDRIVAIAHPENIASRRVMEKVGMKYEKNARYYNTDVAYYSLHREVFQPGDFFYVLRE